MDVDAVDVGRFEVGRFGDLRLEKRGPGAIRFWWRHPGLVFWLWQTVGGVARSGSDDFCATLR